MNGTDKLSFGMVKEIRIKKRREIGVFVLVAGEIYFGLRNNFNKKEKIIILYPAQTNKCHPTW